MTDLVQTSSLEAKGRWSSSPLIVIQDSFSLWTSASLQMDGVEPVLTDVTRYFWYTIFISLDVCVLHFYDISALVGFLP